MLFTPTSHTACWHEQVWMLSVICLFTFSILALALAKYKCHQPCSFAFFLVTFHSVIIFHWIVYILLSSIMVSSVTICSLSPLFYSLSHSLVQCSRWFLMDVSLCGLFFPVHLSVSELHSYKEYGLVSKMLDFNLNEYLA